MTSIMKDIVCYILIYQLFVFGSALTDTSANQTNFGVNSTIKNVDNKDNDTSLLMDLVSVLDNGIQFDNVTTADISRQARVLYHKTVPIPNKTIVKSKFNNYLYDLKKFFKKFFIAYSFWGPEIGFSACMFKHAWHTYPIVSQVGYRVLGTARSLLGGIYQEVYRSFVTSSSPQAEEIPIESSPDGYSNHQNEPSYTETYSPSYPLPHNHNPAPVYGAPTYNRRMDTIVDMLKNLQPKNVTRIARNVKEPGKVRVIGLNPDDLRNLKKGFQPNYRPTPPHPKVEIIEARSVPHYDPKSQIKRAHFEPTTIRIDADLEIVKSNEVSLENYSTDDLHGSSSGENVIYKSPFPNYKLPTKVEYGPPHYEPSPPIHEISSKPHAVYGIPASKPAVSTTSHTSGGGYKPHYGIPDNINVNNLLPAHHHEYHIKHPNEPEPPKWLTFPFENIILEKLGLLPPGVPPRNPSPLKCSQYYAVSLLWRTLETYLARM